MISTDCGDNNYWNVLSSIIAQFIERDTIQLPALRQLADCAVLEPTIGGTGMERNESVACISLQPCMLRSALSVHTVGPLYTEGIPLGLHLSALIKGGILILG